METAIPLAELAGVPIATREPLAEFDWDNTFYIPLDELHDAGDPRFAKLIDDWTGPGRAQDRATFRASVVATIDAIAADHQEPPEQRVAVVCHGGVINNYLAEVLGTPQSVFFHPDYTSVSRVRVGRSSGRMLLSANECGHLRAAHPAPDGPAL